MYERVKALIGKRVRVARGTRVDMRRVSDGYHPWMIWCAGNVPVGSEGTIVDDPNSPCLVQVEWDSGQKPAKGYTFGLSSIGYGLEEIK